MCLFSLMSPHANSCSWCQGYKSRGTWLTPEGLSCGSLARVGELPVCLHCLCQT